MLTVESLDDLVTTTEAATHVGVDAATIRSWASRGHLTRAGIDPRGHNMYRLIDVLRAARDTRRRGTGQRRLA